jgi:hypothetical protein
MLLLLKKCSTWIPESEPRLPAVELNLQDGGLGLGHHGHPAPKAGKYRIWAIPN